MWRARALLKNLAVVVAEVEAELVGPSAAKGLEQFPGGIGTKPEGHGADVVGPATPESTVTPPSSSGW